MIERAVDILRHGRNCAILTGAGISAESNVPTFRGKEGLWGKFKPEELATMEAFVANPKIVWEWYNWRRELMRSVQPNAGHHALWAMEKKFNHFTLMTQNVDGLHRQAWLNQYDRNIADGETSAEPLIDNLLELHGNINANKCIDCNTPCELDNDIDPKNIPACVKCGGKIRPDVVWFGEMLDPEVIDRAFVEAEQADVFLVIGTSALVHPAASLPVSAKRNGAAIIEINLEETPLSEFADISLRGKSGNILPELVNQLRNQR